MQDRRDQVRATQRMALELGVIGLMNVQYAVKGERVYVIEVNPRASRTVPFVSKAIGVAACEARGQGHVRARRSTELGFTDASDPSREYFSVKAPVFPFNRFPGIDMVLSVRRCARPARSWASTTTWDAPS